MNFSCYHKKFDCVRGTLSSFSTQFILVQATYATNKLRILTAVETCVCPSVGPSRARPKSESFGLKFSSNSTFDDLKSQYITFIISTGNNRLAIMNRNMFSFKNEHLSFYNWYRVALQRIKKEQ